MSARRTQQAMIEGMNEIPAPLNIEAISAAALLEAQGRYGVMLARTGGLPYELDELDEDATSEQASEPVQ